jgi:SNF2 family DNA or RNA helicase
MRSGSPLLTLSDYQLVAKEILLKRSRWGLFDEQGVGKTPPTLMAAAERAGLGAPVLVTVPAYLMYNWEREIRRWLPSAQVLRADGERPHREAVFNSNADFILTSYHSWNEVKSKEGPNRSYPILHKRKWAQMIFDESHRLRGRNSNWTKRVFQLQNVDSKNQDTGMWFLTGTPLVRDAGDLWPFLYLQDRHLFRSYWRYVESQCHIITDPWTREVGPVIDPQRFMDVMRRYSIRRLCADIPELAKLDHTTKVVEIPLPPSVRKAITAARKTYVLEHPDLEKSRDFDSGGALVQAMLQMVSNPPGAENPKMKAFRDYLQNEVPHKRVIVGTWYRETARIAADVASKMKRPTVMITGDQSLRQKEHALVTYDGNPRTVLVGTIAAMKEGLNLQAGSDVCFLEESDIPEDNNQLIARAKRRGQREKVHVVQFLTQGWPESTKHRLVSKRERYIRAALMEEFLQGDFK